jgi:hypothetical protein
MTTVDIVDPVRALTATGQLRSASDLAGVATTDGQQRFWPVASPLQPLVQGLRRGGTVALAGASSLVPALLAPASAAGAWVAVVGMPGWGLLAAAQTGFALDRLALVPYPGPEWPAVVAALLDGVDVVVIAPPGPVGERAASRLMARARQRGSVLVPYGQWPGADLVITAGPGTWQGLGTGHGRLRARELTIRAYGRGAAARLRQVRVLLPDSSGQLAACAPGRPSDTTFVPHRAARRSAADRPVLTVIRDRTATHGRAA